MYQHYSLYASTILIIGINVIHYRVRGINDIHYRYQRYPLQVSTLFIICINDIHYSLQVSTISIIGINDINYIYQRYSLQLSTLFITVTKIRLNGPFYVKWTILLSCFIFQYLNLQFCTQLHNLVVKPCLKFQVKTLKSVAGK